MNSLKDGIINDEFNYQGLNANLVDTYSYFENKFNKLLTDYANVYNLDNCYFYIKNSLYCNAYASKNEDYNIISITNPYPILMKDKFDKQFFSNMIDISFINKKSISDAYADLYADTTFQLHDFMLDCSIQYTFSHEFRHLLQFNSSKQSSNFKYSENLDNINFSIQKHAWEFDADRMASYEVLKYVFRIHRNMKNNDNDNDKLICLLYFALSSIFITKDLFYFGVMNQMNNKKYTINKQEFYTKKYSHPHPIVRQYNIFEYFYENIKDDFPHLNIDAQEVLNNILGISKLYFEALIPNQQELYSHYKESTDLIDEINKYNGELYDYAVKDNSIKTLLISSGVNFERYDIIKNKDM